jgi:hypothetical protein
VQQRFAEDPGLDVVSCGTRFVHFDSGGELVVDTELNDPAELDLCMRNIVRCPMTAGHLVRRRVYQRLSGYDVSHEQSNDLDFLIRVCLERPRTAVLPKIVYTYRVHGKSRTLGDNPAMLLKVMRDNVSIVGRHLRGSPMSREDRSELLGLHGRNSARFAWMLAVRGQFGAALRVIRDAVALNPLWPVQVWYWMGLRIVRPPYIRT